MNDNGRHEAVLDTRQLRAALFDLDGVVTKTARVHAAAWKRLFDEFLEARAAPDSLAFEPFDSSDYQRYVDGKPRYEGVESFLAARGIDLPFGSPDDSPGVNTVCALGNRKDALFRHNLEQHGVEVYPSSLDLIGQFRTAGLGTAVVSASRNCRSVLQAAGIEDLFDVLVDGIVAHELALPGKPAPDTFLHAAKMLDVDPARAVVFEDALAGVEAGSRGGFGCVVAVDRSGNPARFHARGADLVVADLDELTLR